jgi:hypothetical protein
MTVVQADKLKTLYRKAVKAAMGSERATPGTATHDHAADAFERAETAFYAFLDSTVRG